jgi:hypothetical protein
MLFVMIHMSQEPKKIKIHINRTVYDAPKPVMTGFEIKELGGGPIDYMLVLTVKKEDEVAGGDDRVINDQEPVELQSGMKFRILNAATFGR